MVRAVAGAVLVEGQVIAQISDAGTGSTGPVCGLGDDRITVGTGGNLDHGTALGGHLDKDQISFLMILAAGRVLAVAGDIAAAPEGDVLIAQVGHLGTGVELSAVAQLDLVVQVGAPTPEGAVVTDGVDGVLASALGQVDDLAQAGHTGGRGVSAVVGGAVTQLAVAIGAEGVDPAVLGEDGHIVNTQDHLDHLQFGIVDVPGQGHQQGQVGVSALAVGHGALLAQLATDVGTPDEEPAQVGAGSSVVLAGHHGDHILVIEQQAGACGVLKLHLNGHGGVVDVLACGQLMVGAGHGHA